jgi:hypothetical protein
MCSGANVDTFAGYLAINQAWMGDTYEIIAMIIPVLDPDSYFGVVITGVAGGFQKVFRQELSLLQKLVRCALHIQGQLNSVVVTSTCQRRRTDIVNEDVQRVLALGYELRGVVQIFPLGHPTLQESLERLLTPR